MVSTKQIRFDQKGIKTEEEHLSQAFYASFGGGTVLESDSTTCSTLGLEQSDTIIY